MDRFHIERVAEHELDSLIFAEISDPVPGKHAFDANDQIISVIGDQFQ